ncbi:MAG: hypothetical protein K0R71_1672 [Bacillales bacterium]|jgi:hypothetical protein|nr:hypothetical protein [Bacillales bacterium]
MKANSYAVKKVKLVKNNKPRIAKLVAKQLVRLWFITSIKYNHKIGLRRTTPRQLPEKPCRFAV